MTKNFVAFDLPNVTIAPDRFDRVKSYTSPHTRQVNMSQAYYSLHGHCILKTLCMGHWQKGVPPFKNKFHDHLF